MRFLIDIVHPADVLLYRHIITGLEAEGHQTVVASRQKDVAIDLLDHYGIPHSPLGRSRGPGLMSMGSELTSRITKLVGIGRRFRPDVVLTRNPAGAIAARLLGARAVFDTDDGKAVGVYWWAAAPFASDITMPDCLADNYRHRRVPYPSYKALAFLHPDRFTPDPSVLSELGVTRGERYFIVRFVAMAAFHDRSEAGVRRELQAETIARLEPHGRVFVSREQGAGRSQGAVPLGLPPHRIHDALAFASLVVGDSQSMSAEAAVLGVPSIRLSTWAGRLAYLSELSDRYRLHFEFAPDRSDEFLELLTTLGAQPTPDLWRGRHQQLLADKTDLTDWYLRFLLEQG